MDALQNMFHALEYFPANYISWGEYVPCEVYFMDAMRFDAQVVDLPGMERTLGEEIVEGMDVYSAARTPQILSPNFEP